MRQSPVHRLARPGPARQPARLVHHALRPGPAGLRRRGGAATARSRSTSTSGTRPNFHSVIVAPRLLRAAGSCWSPASATRRIPVLEGSLAAVLFVEALRTQRLVVYLMVVAAGLAATLPARPPWGTTARRWAGGGLVASARSSSWRPPRSRPGPCRRRSRCGPSTISARTRADLHGVHVGRLLDRPPPGHLRRRPHRPLRGRGAHRVLRGDEPDDEPRPGAVRATTSPTSCGHRAPRCRSTSSHDPRWRVVDRTRWPWSSPAAEAGEAVSGRRPRRPAQVAVLVGPGLDRARSRGDPAAGRRTSAWSPPSSRSTAPPGRRKPGRLGDDPAQDVGAVGSAVVVRGVLEAQRVAREQVELRARDVGHHGDDDVGRAPQGPAARRRRGRPR